MYVKCINDNRMVYLLTVGKRYEVIDEDKNSYTIFNDKGDIWYYDKSLFE